MSGQSLNLMTRREPAIRPHDPVPGDGRAIARHGRSHCSCRSRAEVVGYLTVRHDPTRRDECYQVQHLLSELTWESHLRLVGITLTAHGDNPAPLRDERA